MDPLRWIEAELTDLQHRHLRRQRQVRSGAQSPPGTRISGTSLVNFASNDYLGLASEELVETVLQAITEVGWGSGASPLIVGYEALHASLEKELARFENCEAALLFSSGYAANAGTVPALVGPGDVIFSDARNHASIIDGCRLSGAEIVVYPHVDMTSLRDRLTDASSYRRRLIVTDGLFSMDGDLAPLTDLADLAEQHEAILMVDEAHATGVLGEAGRGVAELQQVEDGVHVRVGTLSKALGSSGGFVAGSQLLIDWLVNRARPYVFSTASPAVLAAAGMRSLEIVAREPERRQSLLKQAAWFHDQLLARGWLLDDHQSQIMTLPAETPERALHWSSELRRDGFLVPAIRPPSVVEGGSCLRISLCYGQQPQQLAALVESLSRLDRGAHQ